MIFKGIDELAVNNILVFPNYKLSQDRSLTIKLYVKPRSQLNVKAQHYKTNYDINIIKGVSCACYHL